MHNLIVKNDETSDYVQFTVNVPDGYNKFTVDDLNGSIINQNYLKVGDTITFRFSNTPMEYDITDTSLNIIAKEQNEAPVRLTMKEDNTKYNKLKLDLNHYYRLVFIPVYLYYDGYMGKFTYVFNPCDATQLLLEPSKYVPGYKLDPPNNYIELPFTGKYVMGLVETSSNVIPDITLTIGESINNSKMRNTDAGAFQITNNTVNEVNVQQISRQSYNYGDVWTYPVANLIMKHKPTIIINGEAEFEEYDAMAVLYTYKDSETYTMSTIGYSIPASIYINEEGKYIIDNTKYMLFTNKNDGTPITNVVTKNKIISGELLPIYIRDTDNNGFKLFHKTTDWINGDEFSVSNKYYVTYDTSTFVDMSTVTYINNTWAYDLRINNIALRDPINPNIPLQLLDDATHTFMFVTADQAPIVYNNIIPIIPNGESIYWIYDVDADKYWQCRIKLVDMGRLDVANVVLYMCGIFKVERMQNVICVIKNAVTGIYTGRYDNIELQALNEPEFSTRPIQFTDNRFNNTANMVNNDEDIYIKSDKPHELTLGMHKLTNDIHYIQKISGSNAYDIINTQHFLWSHPNGDTAELLAFIPIKCNMSLSMCQAKPGLFYVCDVDGFYASSLDDTASIFIADGHETLNIEPPTEDDSKFKTFNGSLTFDRSDARVTRLFSNDVTGATLGYLNNMLAAYLSRFYTVVDYTAYDLFLDTNKIIGITDNAQYVNSLFNTYKHYTGDHEVVLASCYDMVKLIGSENVVNNCFPNLCSEEGNMLCGIINRNDFKEGEFTYNTQWFYYKYMHYYNSGYDSMPYLGQMNDGLVGGLNIMTCNNIDKEGFQYINNCNEYKPLIIVDKTKADANQQTIYNRTGDDVYEHNDAQGLGYIETLPVYRIYRNANFEQSDLTITTGGIKTIHPIYMQSTPRALMNNVLYMLDYAIMNMLKQYNKLLGPLCIIANSMATDITTISGTGVEYPMKRLSDYMGLDAFMLLNYIIGNSLNEYENVNVLRNSVMDEEVIHDMVTVDQTTNIQLFSNKYFNFRKLISEYAMVQYKQQYVEQVYYNDILLGLYYKWNTNEEYGSIINSINGLINDTSTYNNLKGCNIFVCKLGEYLQFPKILFAGTNCFNNTLNISVHNYNMSTYVTPLKTNLKAGVDYGKTEYNDDRPEQKVNTYLFGVMFKYHQLTLGYQNLHNELGGNEYMISNALGNRHFTLVLYDEYGRMIPNKDTSQHFDNNLYLELSLS